MRLSYVPCEGNPSPFDKKLGCVETGEVDEGEVVMTQTVAGLLAGVPQFSVLARTAKRAGDTENLRTHV